MTTLFFAMAAKTILLTLFGLGVWALLAATRCRDARMEQCCWRMVLAVGLLGAALPIGLVCSNRTQENAVTPQPLSVSSAHGSESGAFPLRSGDFDFNESASFPQKSESKEPIAQAVPRTPPATPETQTLPPQNAFFTRNTLFSAIGTLWLFGIAFFLTLARSPSGAFSPI